MLLDYITSSVVTAAAKPAAAIVVVVVEKQQKFWRRKKIPYYGRIFDFLASFYFGISSLHRQTNVTFKRDI